MNQYIKFIKKEDIIEEINGGFSGARLYKITRRNHRFFLKIFDGKYNKKEILRIKKSLKIYRKLKIHSLKMIDYGDIKEFNKYYIVYNYIEGENLITYEKKEKYSMEKVCQLGKQIGEELLRLKEYEKYEKGIFLYSDINKMIEKTTNYFNSIMKDDTKINRITNYFTLEEMNELRNKLEEYVDIIKKEEPKLIHGDIKRGNIMIDKEKQLYLVDIESMQVGYDIMNFEYQMTWGLIHENDKAFLKGYFDGIYHNTRPKDFNYHIIFIAIVNFFNVLCNDYQKLGKDEFELYLKKCRKVFDEVKNMNLEEESIL